MNVNIPKPNNLNGNARPNMGQPNIGQPPMGAVNTPPNMQQPSGNMPPMGHPPNMGQPNMGGNRPPNMGTPNMGTPNMGGMNRPPMGGQPNMGVPNMGQPNMGGMNRPPMGNPQMGNPQMGGMNRPPMGNQQGYNQQGYNQQGNQQTLGKKIANLLPLAIFLVVLYVLFTIFVGHKKPAFEFSEKPTENTSKLEQKISSEGINVVSSKVIEANGTVRKETGYVAPYVYYFVNIDVEEYGISKMQIPYEQYQKLEDGQKVNVQLYILFDEMYNEYTSIKSFK